MKLIKRNTKYTIIIGLVFLALYFLQENKTKADNTEGQQTEQIEKKAVEQSTKKSKSARSTNTPKSAKTSQTKKKTTRQQNSQTQSPIDKLEIPTITGSQNEQIIEHTGFTISYNTDWNLPNWAAYELTSLETNGENSRTNKFLPDPLVKGKKVVTTDYSNSGYDRGHMVPAGDMKWSEQAMKECFYMTNMCPQLHNINSGDWKDLEELARDWAVVYGNIYIACGPIVTDTTKTIGKQQKIVVPQQFYKVFLRQKDNEWTAIGFVMDNKAGSKPLMTYLKTVDEIEQITQIDFFPNLPDDIENIVEANINLEHWSMKR